MKLHLGVALTLAFTGILLAPSPVHAREACATLALSRTSFYSGAGTANWSVKITAPTESCSWSIAIDRGINDPSAWLILNGDATLLTTSGVGTGTFTLKTLTNTTGAFRYGSITIGGATLVTYKVTQEKPADSIKPVVTITNPLADATVAGVVALSATASDNVGIKGVQFKVNGINLGLEDTTAPYSVSWNTVAVADGPHALTATARDAAGNSNSVSISVAVKNVVDALCTDPAATNFNGPLPCTYPPPVSAPGTPTPVTPLEGAVNVPLPTTLSWSASGATAFVLRLGTSNPPVDVVSNQSSSTFVPALQHGTTYYWQVDGTNSVGTTSGAVWSFTTAAAPPPPANNTALHRLRVVNWNVRQGYTLNNTHDHSSQVDLLASLNPDVIVLQEVTLADGDMPVIYEQKLEERTGKNWHRQFVQFVTGAPITNSLGTMILTWLPVDQALSKVACLVPGDERKTSENSCTSFVTFQVTVNSVPLTITGVHLNAKNLDFRTYQLSELMAWLETLGPNRMVTGDFNMDPTDVLWTTWTNYTDVWAAVVGTTGDQGYTKDVRDYVGGPGRIDYTFIPVGTTRIGVQTFGVLKTSLSDHHLLVGDYIIK
jgi:endonuclease/exonuclease/phosphatase family metal-dependent hydrolase